MPERKKNPPKPKKTCPFCESGKVNLKLETRRTKRYRCAECGGRWRERVRI